MRSGNPALTSKTFTELTRPGESAMTIGGTVNKTFLLLTLVTLGAGISWNQAGIGSPVTMPLLLVGTFGGLLMALATIFRPTWARITAPLYALLEGLALGAISALTEARTPGVALPAVGLTFATLFALLTAYRSGLIRATENFKLGVVAATGGVAIFYLVTLALSLFGIHLPMMHEGGLLGIGISLVVVVIAALNLVLDFDFIEQGAREGAPAHMEWYGAFGLMVTLVWLYLEMLRLLSKLQERR